MTRLAVALLIPAVTILAWRDHQRQAQVYALAKLHSDDIARSIDACRRAQRLLLDRARVAYALADYRAAADIARAIDADRDTLDDVWLPAQAIIRASADRLIH